MAKLTARLKALEIVNRTVKVMPLIMIIGDEGLTNNQKLDKHKAENEGRNVVKISKDKSQIALGNDIKAHLKRGFC